MNYRIINAEIINEGERFKGEVWVKDERISKIVKFTDIAPKEISNGTKTIDAKGKLLIPGVIDDQVHFRDPGLTHKGDIFTESRAAVAGGVTSYMEMPNTVPQILTQELLDLKYNTAAEKSLANYSFYMGASNDNIDEIVKTDPFNVCGIKVFMGASTGNMLVDDPGTLNDIFKNAPCLVAVHCEDEQIIRKNAECFKKNFGENIPVHYHPEIRSEEACYKSSSLAVELATKHNTRLHILHLSTAREMNLFSNKLLLEDKMITAEVCVHHLWFDEKDYERLGNRIKWNPAIKTKGDREALLKALLDNRLDVVATDHAPHTMDEKQNTYFKAPSGGPLVQHSLQAMFDLYHQGKINPEFIVEKMCHAPAKCFRVKERGFIREGFFADLVIVDINQNEKVDRENILYKCKWSPFEDYSFKSKITHTFVNGNLVYETGAINDSYRGKRLEFER
ncbi:MAG: dihydroorotase [Bacteroidales bacterium]|nr:dihydroorotase [Bacteroidales bacterium]MCF8343485.1 dihydroorotase [Bacteroidales bacterium]MCF8352117.1 dihydroorotase [Bacteroidales bacterium]MCF8376940.1 dihydroorotase [Bacteroidales bacterium]MCF8402140.1 dihydroorotase [Bacteroidales bacterium]